MEVTTDVKIEDDTNGSSGDHSQELYKAFRPMLLTMKVLGMYPLQETGVGKGCGNKLLWLYSALMLLAMWGSTCAFVVTLWTYQGFENLMFQLVLLILHLYLSCQGTVVLSMSVRRKGWRELFKVYQYAREAEWHPKGYSSVSRRVYYYVGTSWFLMVCSQCLIIYNCFCSEVFIDFFAAFDPTSYNLGLRCYTAVEYTLINVYWVIPIALSLLLNDMVATDFRLFNEKLHLEQRESPLGLCANLGKVREAHERLVGVTEAVDSLLSVLVSFCILFNLVMSCFSIYSLIYQLQKPSLTLSYLFWTVTNLVIVFVTTAACASVNTQAHRSLGIMVNLKVTEVTESFSIQMQMFLTKLTGSSIGITALNMFVMDKNTILTVVGLLLTYVVVFLQFKPNTTTCPVTCPVSNATVVSAL